MKHPYCSAVDPQELPGETERRVAAGLLFASEEAHDAYHRDVQFRVVINSLAASLVPMVQDMAIAAQGRVAKSVEDIRAIERGNPRKEEQ